MIDTGVPLNVIPNSLLCRYSFNKAFLQLPFSLQLVIIVTTSFTIRKVLYSILAWKILEGVSFLISS